MIGAQVLHVSAIDRAIGKIRRLSRLPTAFNESRPLLIGFRNLLGTCYDSENLKPRCLFAILLHRCTHPSAVHVS